MKKQKYRILAVTLARSGSKAIKRKNLAPINGKPLIYYTIKEALKSKLVSRYIVSTDDEKIRKASIKYGAEVPFFYTSSESLGGFQFTISDYPVCA